MKILRGFVIVPAVLATAVVAVLSSATPSEAKWDRVRFGCKAETETTKLDARYEERTRVQRSSVRKDESRSQFRAQFEGSGEGLVPGAQLGVLVDSVAVGNITLVEEVPGEVEGQLRFDSKARGGKKVQPFPNTFPAIDQGTLVELQLAGATLIACELQ